IVSVFNLDGTFLARVTTGGSLNSPWGMAIAPSSFGSIAGDLLVGNFGDGRINILGLNANGTGTPMGQLLGANGSPIDIPGLWGLIQGNNGNGGSSNKIYFTAGPADESHGLFGVLQTVPEPSSGVSGLI